MIENIVFDYGGVLVQYDFVAFFGKLLGSREQGQWFMDHVLPEEVGAAMDRELHPFDYYIRQQQERWPEYAETLSYFASYYTDVFTVETPGIRELILVLKERGFHVYGLSNWSSKLLEVKAKFSILASSPTSLSLRMCICSSLIQPSTKLSSASSTLRQIHVCSSTTRPRTPKAVSLWACRASASTERIRQKQSRK